ncbi:MAG TPA: glucokinase [Stellaceae bacterium]|nr:glucokinase [Stellaceae bacterium]
MNGDARLVGDIGGTNVRFALLDATGKATRARVFASDDFASLAEAIEAYLAAEGTRPAAAALSIASPVAGDTVSLTNHPWSFSIAALKARLGLARLVVVNDFAANALAVPHLAPGERAQVGGGSAVADAPIAVLGPGTGLGVGGLVPAPSGPVALAGEGGHATLPAADARESEVVAHLRRRFDHVSAERVLSGPGLVNLYQTLAELEGTRAHPYTAAQIADRHMGENDPLARATVEMFCAMLGTVAGDLALTLGARGGVYIAGGIVPRLGSLFAKSRFRTRFEDKGRFSDYLAAIPTYVMTCAIPAFLGLAALLERGER